MPESRAAAGALWQLRPLLNLSWHDWAEEGSVAFDETSGQIVEVDVLRGALLARLEEDTASIEMLASELAADLGQVSDAEFQATVAHVVEQFQRLGWLAPIMAE